MPPTLSIIMPIYNEEDSISIVLSEWTNELNRILPNSYLFILVDGSSDETSSIIEKDFNNTNFFLHIILKNSTHGEKCMEGYKKALSIGSDWILQIDSDYQCDPIYFKTFWNKISSSNVIMGKRTKRLDGFHRLIISNLISLWISFFIKRFCEDPNVPYRLFNKDVLQSVLPNIPHISLFNIYMSYLIMNDNDIMWIDITFRKRIYGKSSHRIGFALKALTELTKSLKFLK